MTVDTDACEQARHRARLARMAGQIADFFRSLPEPQAVAETARHINLYWSPVMRRDLATLFGPDDTALHHIVRKAWSSIRFPSG